MLYDVSIVDRDTPALRYFGDERRARRRLLICPGIAGLTFVLDPNRAIVWIYVRPGKNEFTIRIYDDARMEGGVSFGNILMDLAVTPHTVVSRNGRCRIVEPPVGAQE